MIIHAPNIHTGGGKVLLEALLDQLEEPCTVIADQRLQLERGLHPKVKLISIVPNLLSRLLAEFKLAKVCGPGEVVLCFGNLPPLFTVQGRVVVFFQNTILLKKYAHFHFPFMTRIKHGLERFWFRARIGKVEKILVQSESVRRDLLREFPELRIEVAPFAMNLTQTPNQAPKIFDFVYVSSGDRHKNHAVLFEAWRILAERNVFPTLALTIPAANAELCREVTELQGQKLKVQNFADLKHSEVLDLYRKSKALVYPSLTESFGLPLLEARALGLQIVAAELDYVREVVIPDQTFDPHSAQSLARAIARHLDLKTFDSQVPVMTAAEFLAKLDKP